MALPGNEPVDSEELNNDHQDDGPAFCDLYKYKNRTAAFSQEKRRELILQKQKEKRSETVDEKRDLSELFVEDEPEERMECGASSPPRHHIHSLFRNKLMLSEWFTEIPEDLSSNWLIKLCPGGVRYLVAASKGVTTCYYRNGHPSFRFKSNIPGGNPERLTHKFTLLDCVFVKNLNVFFVYDVLAWNSLSLIDAEAQMRFCWLKAKFKENPELAKTKHYKNFSFVLMDCFPAQNDLLQDHLFTPLIVNESEVTFEGLIFYHKEGHYVTKKSPLVGWLKTFMLPELLHIDVDAKHLQNKPADYESVQQYLKSTKKKKTPEEKPDAMEMETVEVVENNEDCVNML